MLKVYLVLVLFAVALAESVRETETWMPLKVVESHDDLVSSGDFEFPNERTRFDDEEDLEDDYDNYSEDISGSGDDSFPTNIVETSEPEEIDNYIPDIEPSAKPLPTDNDIIAVRQNEVAHPPSVQLSHAGEQNIFNKTEVLAAVIAGGAVGLLFAILLILLLVYRMKKKDEGSYDMGKKPIYKKAPTAEIYA